MRLLTFILFCWTSTLTNGQTCETYNNRTINCKDKDSLKQGYWYEYAIQKILTTDSFERNPNAIGFHNDEGKIEIPIAEGYYKNNKRTGEWKFYKGYLYNNIYANPTFHEQKVIFTDSGYLHIIDSFWHFFARLSDDSSMLTGTVFIKNSRLAIYCTDRKCSYKDPFDGNKKHKFSINDLDAVLIRLSWYGRMAKKRKPAVNR